MTFHYRERPRAIDHKDRGAGGAGGASAPPTIFSIEKLLFYCFHRYAIINEDFRQ